MLNDDMIDLYYMILEEEAIKQELCKIKHSLNDIKENMEETKQKIISGMEDINHRFASYKNMDIILVKKPTKIKLDKEKINELIEDILSLNIDNSEKVKQIFSVLKPKESGELKTTLNIKLKKRKKKNSDSE